MQKPGISENTVKPAALYNPCEAFLKPIGRKQVDDDDSRKQRRSDYHYRDLVLGAYSKVGYAGTFPERPFMLTTTL